MGSQGNNFVNASPVPDNLNEYVGSFGTTLGTPISPYFVVTASHALGGSTTPPVTTSPASPPATNTFNFANGTGTITTYSMERVATDNDLAVWEIIPGQAGNPQFSLYAPIYTQSNEINQSLVVMGLGTVRGAAETLNGNLTGWAWGSATSNESWGTNTVDAVETNTGQPGLNGEYLYYTFDRQTDANGNVTDPNEAMLSPGDSGGPLFVLNPTTGTYQLAGTNTAVDVVYPTATSQQYVPACIFDARGYYNDEGQLITGSSPVPEGSYDVRLSSDVPFLDEVVYGVTPNLTWDGQDDGVTWDLATTDNWNDGSSASTGYADGANVTFDDTAPATDTTIELSGRFLPGSVTVNSSVNNYVFGGSGSIGGSGLLTKSGGSTLTMNVANTYSGGTTINGGTLVIGAAGALPAGGGVTNNANLTINARTTAGNVSGSGTTTVASGVAFSAAAFSQSNLIDNGSATITGNGTIGLMSGNGSLTIGTGSGGNTLNLASSGGVSTISTLTIAPGSTLNLNNNELIINYGSSADPITTIQSYLISGYNGGSWNGAGIDSVAAQSPTDGLEYSLGFADGAEGIVAGLSSGQIEVKYTLVGDLNLDGIVDGLDFSILAGHFNKFDNNWDDGDVLYHGLVDGLDFGALVSNFGHTAAGGDVTLGAADWAAMDSFASLEGVTADLPEPTSTALAALTGAVMMRRRPGRRRSG